MYRMLQERSSLSCAIRSLRLLLDYNKSPVSRIEKIGKRFKDDWRIDFSSPKKHHVLSRPTIKKKNDLLVIV